MSPAVHINPGWIAGMIVSIVFVIVYPLMLAILAHRRFGVSWRYFGFGALIFFLFQIISRVPAVQLIQGAITPQLTASKTLLIVWLTILTITAGLFEEMGRYVGYRWLMGREEKTWRKAVMYGIGHGGLESMLLVGGLLLLTLVQVIAFSSINLNTLSASQHALVVQQLNAINAQPTWTTLLQVWERFWAVPFHIAMSVVVLQVFRRNNIGWLWLAILAHALLDFMAAVLPQVLGSSVSSALIVEGWVASAGIVSLWIIWKLRDHPEQTTIAGEPKPVEPGTTAVM
ncbi:MAG TPA: YhfC family glutamic-type intramembrane protease [Ktedonobacteraceae bacterium]|nr:YhfC family glutamic-type intramembrane protease [Ktedonobacteraceae bacterium]